MAELAGNLAITINLYALTPRCCMQAYGSLGNTWKWIKQQQNSLTDIVEQQKCFVGCFFISKWPTHAQRGTRYEMMQHKRQREFFLCKFTQIWEVTRVRYVQMWISRARLFRLVLAIAVCNINGYRFSHSFIYVQLIASSLLNRWSLHFSYFLLRVNVNYGQVNMFVPTVWDTRPITLTRSVFTCL